MFRLKQDEELTLEKIQVFATEHREKMCERYKCLHNAYLTKYDIFKQKDKPEYKPDNRLAANFAKYIVDTMTGFFIGIPVKVLSKDSKVNEFVDFVNTYNISDDINAEEIKNAAIFGHCFEIEYIDEQGNNGIAVVSPETGFMIYDDSVLLRKRAFVRLYKEADNKVIGSVSTANTVQYFDLLPECKWTSEPILHGFDGVPAVEIMINEERQGLFESVLNLINAYNKAISEKANDVDYFADAYLKVLGAKLNKDELNAIRDNRIINFDGAGLDKLDVGFLDKPNGDTTQENLIDRLETLIFKIAMVADISDENFAGSSSGISLKYKMQAMSNLAKAMARKFRASLQERYRLIFSNPVNKLSEDDYIKLSYLFTLNYPANLLEESQIAGNLAGITSKETQLSVLSIVDNPKEELEEIKKDQDLIGYETDYPTNRTGEEDV